VGDIPNARPKLVVNDPTLRSPTVRQMSATVRSVLRSSAAARSERPPELAAEVRRREPCGPRQRRHIELFSVAGVDQVLGT